MGQYRKKPVVIEAIKWDGNHQTFFDISFLSPKTALTIAKGYLEIRTLEGDMKVDIGDMVICGVNNELYPCKPDIFEKTYELVNP